MCKGCAKGRKDHGVRGLGCRNQVRGYELGVLSQGFGVRNQVRSTGFGV
jgi:hypothetical protein